MNVHSRRLYESVKVKSSKILLHFLRSGSGPVAANGSLNDFPVAGCGKQMVASRAGIQGETVFASTEGIAEPQQVRYGWRIDTDVNFSPRGSTARLSTRTHVK